MAMKTRKLTKIVSILSQNMVSETKNVSSQVFRAISTIQGPNLPIRLKALPRLFRSDGATMGMTRRFMLDKFVRVLWK
jgi:hypothetical protein